MNPMYKGDDVQLSGTEDFNKLSMMLSDIVVLWYKILAKQLPHLSHQPEVSAELMKMYGVSIQMINETIALEVHYLVDDLFAKAKGVG